MPVSESRKAANARWDAAHLKRMSLVISVEEYEALQRLIKASGDSQNMYLRKLVQKDIEEHNPA